MVLMRAGKSFRTVYLMNSEVNQLDEETVRSIASQFNIPLVGIIDPDPVIEMLPYSKKRREENHGLIPYVRTKDFLRIDYQSVMANVKSIIVIGVPYPLKSERIKDFGHFAYLSSVACGIDYHQTVMRKMDALCEEISIQFGNAIHFKKFVDNSRLMDKASAWKAGLGFFGKNNLLINPHYGSAWNIGQILLDQKILHKQVVPLKNQCGNCTKCLESCPNHALGDQGFQLFYERCISYLTQKKKLTTEQEKRIRYFLYGCDICQWVCPFNHRADKISAQENIVFIDDILNQSEEEIRAHYANHSLSWQPPSILIRNARILKKHCDENNK
jgi:epoxyqueuosine reductase